MILKRIKATAAKNTGKLFKSTAPVPSIEKPFPASRSYWHRGIECENWVAESYARQGFEPLGHRLKTPFGELDLLMRSPDGTLTGFEVKTKTADLADRISRRQLKKLERIFTWMLQQNENSQFLVCFVAGPEDILVLALAEISY
ncbi:MAG: hypothetical protein C5B49_11835 [Bdellovibrio sp.]|nr:MAG: hypothetical protein C5B49_11835 [Bdellovibrio sp.]